MSGQTCGIYRSASVTLGPVTGTVTPPFEMISSSPWDDISDAPDRAYSERLCGSVNENYRGVIRIRCVEGSLVTETDGCEPQWTEITPVFPPTPRSQAQAVTLSDGAILLLGGFDTTSRKNDVWLWYPPSRNSQLDDNQASQASGIITIHQFVLVTRDFGPPDTYDARGGSWKEFKLPAAGTPWSPRLGHSAVRVADASSRDHIMSARSQLLGVDPRGCSVDNSLIECITDAGPVGRRIIIDPTLQRCRRFETNVMISGGSLDALALSFEIGSINCTVQLRTTVEGRLQLTGCVISTASSIRYKTRSCIANGLLTIAVDFHWDTLQLQLVLDGNDLVTMSLPEVHSGTEVGLNAIHFAAWQEPWTSVTPRMMRARNHSITMQAGMWTELASPAPWEERTQVATLPLRDGTVMLIGGQHEGRLGDVWRWIPFTCSHQQSDYSMNGPAAEDLYAIENEYLAQFEVDCEAVITGTVSTTPFVQYVVFFPTRLLNGRAEASQWVSLTAKAPFSARSGATATELMDGSVLLFGGFDGSFTNEVWKWKQTSHPAQICTVAWKGIWEQLTAAPWDPRYGLSSINLYSANEWGADAVLIFGGFGKASKSIETLIVGRSVSVQLSGSETLFSDVWCYEDERWSRITQAGPLTKRYHAALTRIGNDSFVVLGGYDENSRPIADVWQWRAEPAAGSLCSVEVST
ncbi:hypothetical protein FOL47_003738 [Perkinsus chesapeaki]|uniref:Uncharacterized protein n=1 Tax=Perkinsus chesapeaki TaxID=330153 RepID=A0A7J6M6D8_PERCH|nr:hypothetical protein FOL47_003738 [Perkinsus chesapeaki]